VGKPETDMVLILADGQQWKKTNLPRKDIWLVLFFGMFFADNCLQSTKYFLINRKWTWTPFCY
jgi:hypothetical protein